MSASTRAFLSPMPSGRPLPKDVSLGLGLACLWAVPALDTSPDRARDMITPSALFPGAAAPLSPRVNGDPVTTGTWSPWLDPRSSALAAVEHPEELEQRSPVRGEARDDTRDSIGSGPGPAPPGD